MAEGFKKYFNGTTIAGRANVAKATYATMALIYLFYRVRRGKDAPKPEEVAIDVPLEQPNLEPSREPEKPEKPEKDCAICRERVRLREKEDPPPPPPPPSGGGPDRQSCQCEENPQSKQQQPQQQGQNCSAPDADVVHPARELITQMQEAASRVLRNVLGAVLGDSPTQATDSDERCSCCQLSVMEQAEDEECDYEVDNKQELNRERRTAPRHCEPTTGLKLPSQTEEQQQQATAESTKSSQSQSQSASQAPPQYRCFEDDFASEMFFEHFEE